MELLLAGGANVFLLSSDGTDAYARCQRQIVCLQLAEAMLQQAIYGNSVEYLEQIVVSIRNGAYIDMRVGNGWTPLMHLISLYEEESEDMISDAVRKVNNDVLVAAVTELLEAGADIHATEDENGWTALHFAASVGSPELFTLLQEHGADSTAITADGLTVRDIALNEQRPALLELILTSTEQEENEEL